MSALSKIVVAGAVVGFLEVAGIWFDPAEPHPGFIVAAGTLNGVMIALLIRGLLDAARSLLASLWIGMLCGVLSSLVVFLAKGGWSTWDAPYVVPAGAIVGLILGPLVRRLGRGSGPGALNEHRRPE